VRVIVGREAEVDIEKGRLAVAFSCESTGVSNTSHPLCDVALNSWHRRELPTPGSAIAATMRTVPNGAAVDYVVKAQRGGNWCPTGHASPANWQTNEMRVLNSRTGKSRSGPCRQSRSMLIAKG